MATESQAELLTKETGLKKKKYLTDYDQYLADLATQYGVSTDQLNANLESRGILRSGEAGTSRARLGSAEEAARTAAKSTYDYNVGIEDINLLKGLAALQAAGGGTGGGGGGTGGGGTKGDEMNILPEEKPKDAPEERPVRGPGSPGNPNAVRPGAPVTVVPVTRRTGSADQMERTAPKPVTRRTGSADQIERTAPAPAPRPVRDAVPRATPPVTNMPRPGTVTPAPAPAPAPRTGSADQMERTAPKPAVPDLSGIDWAGLGKMMGKPTPPPAPAKPKMVTIKPPSARNR